MGGPWRYALVRQHSRDCRRDSAAETTWRNSSHDCSMLEGGVDDDAEGCAERADETEIDQRGAGRLR